MDRYTLVGMVLLTLGLVGYVVGIYIEYPGRAFSVTAIMVGIGLVAIGGPSSTRANT